MSAYPAPMYAWLEGGHGAAKLHDSGVAPLVGAARGYETVTSDNLAEKLEVHQLGSAASRHARQLKRDVGKAELGMDGMLMPWFAMDQVAKRAMSNAFPARTTLQVRPSSQVDGIKYDLLTGNAACLDIHPATPISWINSAPRVLMTEGILKGDAALSALLCAHGADGSALLADHDGNPLVARRALREAMEAVPVGERTLIVSFVGVGTWHNNPEWNATNWRGREAWVAYDADTATNPDVWRQAMLLFDFLTRVQKTSEPRLVVIPEIGGAPGAGLDDFLGSGHTWDEIAGLLEDLPDQPAGGGPAREGLWSVSEDGTQTRTSLPTMTPNGTPGAARWETKVELGGRVSSIWTRRTPTREELATGVLGRGVSVETERSWDAKAGAEVEITWRDPVARDKIRSASVSGPSTILAALPQDWPRAGAITSPELLRHPKWPPRAAEGVGFLEAIKAHRPEETRDSQLWESMGWVPREGSSPAFLIGDVLMTSDGPISSGEVNGLTETELPGAADFGIILPDSDYDEAEPSAEGEWIDQGREDFEAVFDAYITSGAWTNKRYGPLVMAAALRPCLPMTPRTNLYLTGKRRSGKSWSAWAIMGFWQAIAGTWSNDRLPGSAKDTVASTENAVSRACIWVADDLAPSSSRDRAVHEEAAMGDMLRAIHNGRGKKRMGPDMKARESRDPRALFVVTAENEPSVSSVADRVVTLKFGEGALGSQEQTSQVEVINSVTGQAARLTGAFIRWIAWRGASGEDNELGKTGWAATYAACEAKMERAKNVALTFMSQGDAKDRGKAARHAKMAADLMVTWYELADFCEFLGVRADILERVQSTELVDLIAEQVAFCRQAQAMTEPGQSLIEALRAVLAAGSAHVVRAAEPSVAPGRTLTETTALGWSFNAEGEPRPTGRMIGYLVEDSEGKSVVLFSVSNAFNIAKTHHPDLIPHGSKADPSWRSMWDEALATEQAGLNRRKNASGTGWSTSVQHRATRASGVPISLDTLLGSLDEDEPVGA